MATIRPFAAFRPAPELVAEVAALPYDVYNRKEAKEEVKRTPRSFLAIDRPETVHPDDFDMYSDEAYQTAKQLLEKAMQDGTYVEEDVPVYYIYELVMNGRSQTGLVACASIDDYQNADANDDLWYRMIVSDAADMKSFIFLIDEMEEEQKSINGLYTTILKYPEQSKKRMKEIRELVQNLEDANGDAYDKINEFVDTINLKGY